MMEPLDTESPKEKLTDGGGRTPKGRRVSKPGAELGPGLVHRENPAGHASGYKASPSDDSLESVPNPLFPAAGDATAAAAIPVLRNRTEMTKAQAHQSTDSWRWQTRRFVDHPVTQLAVILLIAADVLVLILDLTGVTDSSDYTRAEYWVTVGIITLLTGEVGLRMYGLGLTDYFKEWINILDLGIVALSVVLQIISFFSVVPLRMIRPVARGVRAIRFMVKLRQQTRAIPRIARLYVTQNKRRFRKYGFDLDLAYITDCVIGMSVPAVGKEAVYRNPIKDVARFLAKYHREHFRIYNLCSEREYPAEIFDNRVSRVRIQDHSVPTLSTLWRVCEHMKKWMAEDFHNVIVVHCKGGKGRTGTVICSWLLYNKEQKTAAEALELFATRRTDEKIKGKLQGVDTRSQVRYIEYFERVVRAGQLPPIVRLEITSITINQMPKPPKESGSKLNLMKGSSGTGLTPAALGAGSENKAGTAAGTTGSRRKTLNLSNEQRQSIFTTDQLEDLEAGAAPSEYTVSEFGDETTDGGGDEAAAAFVGMGKPWFACFQGEESKINHYGRPAADLEAEEESGQYPGLSIKFPISNSTSGITVETQEVLPMGGLQWNLQGVYVAGDAMLALSVPLRTKEDREIFSFNFHTAFINQDCNFELKLTKYDLDFPQKAKKACKKLLPSSFEVVVKFAPA